MNRWTRTCWATLGIIRQPLLTPEEERLSAPDQQRIEQLFTESKQDRSKAYELKRELDRLDVFGDYENRFLDLFSRTEAQQIAVGCVKLAERTLLSQSTLSRAPTHHARFDGMSALAMKLFYGCWLLRMPSLGKARTR